MKRLIILLIALGFQNLSFSNQDSPANFIAQSSSVTVVQKSILANGNLSYSLISNKTLLSHRVDVWESRMLITYPELVSINLNETSQSILIELDSAHTEETLNSILSRFDVTNFTIQAI